MTESNAQQGSVNKRIIEGKLAQLRQFPYIVLIRRRNSPYFTAGGALVSVNYVLTAASAVINFKDAREIELTMGITNVDKLDYHGFRVYGNEILFHPEYRQNVGNHDLALIELEKGVPRCRYLLGVVAPIFIDTTKRSTPFEGLILGWGATAEDETISPDLRYGVINVLPLNECKIPYTEGNQIYCSNSTQVGLCVHDLGGPVVTASGLVGIASQTSCKGGYTDIFTDISRYESWLFSILKFG